MRKPTKDKDVTFYVGPEITFLGKAEELTAGWCGNLTELAGSGKWQKGAGAEASDDEADAGEVKAYEDAGGKEESGQAGSQGEVDEEESQ